MIGLFNYYRMKTNENDEVTFQRVKEEDITICGRTIEEVITILSALDIERETEIKMTMKNLRILFEKAKEEETRLMEEQIKNMFNGNT